jgi:hypothetical protein
MRQFEPRVGIRTSSFGCQPGPLDLEVRRHNSATGISLSAPGSFQLRQTSARPTTFRSANGTFFRSHQVGPLPRFWTGDIILTFPTV